MALTPYTGQWTKDEAAHLLRRTLFGPTLQQINDSVALGLDATVTQLFTLPSYTYPISFLPDETVTPFLTSWVNYYYPTDSPGVLACEIARRDSMIGWLHERLVLNNFSLKENMCLFWHNHFAASPTIDSRASFYYFRLIELYSLGNFKDLMIDMTVDVCMLKFLNGAENIALSPNENYAREFFEMYTIGKGPLIAAGDYTNYTELDVQEAAKIFTGWKVDGLLSSSSFTSSSFDPSLHDTTTKNLSYHFDNAVISNNNELEYMDLIDIVFGKIEVAKNISRKLYKWFVNHDITADIELNVINELATLIFDNNYDISQALTALLKSQHFYDISFRGSILKSPIDMIYSFYNSNHVDVIYNVNTVSFNYFVGNEVNKYSSLMNMNIYLPTNVAGWNAYYQAPGFYQNWVNASLIKIRLDFIDMNTIFDGIVIGSDLIYYKPNFLLLLDETSVPSDPNILIDEISFLFCPKDLSSLKKIELKNILTNGLPDFEWTVLYNDYISNPGDLTIEDQVRNQFTRTLNALYRYPEFQTK